MEEVLQQDKYDLKLYLEAAGTKMSDMLTDDYTMEERFLIKWEDLSLSSLLLGNASGTLCKS
jgi:hypothetical protein